MGKSLNIFYSNNFLNHETPPGHPEHAGRLEAIISALTQSAYVDALQWKNPRKASRQEIELAHTESHIDSIYKICASGGGYLDADTPVCQESYNVGLQSVGAWLDAVDLLCQGESSFIISRPPGHHAEADRPMGFCLFSNAAIAAKYALNNKNINKVAIFDWDVHHGNGTQEIVQHEPNIAYASIHQFPFYPGTGLQTETGKCDNILNIPVPSGLSRQDYISKFDNLVIPFLISFEPDLLYISAGFDAHFNDPLGGLLLEANDFKYMTQQCRTVLPQLLIGLEGGYDVNALSECSVAIVEELIERN